MQQLPKVTTVGIICKHDKPEAWEAAKELVAWLGERGVAGLVNQSAAMQAACRAPQEDTRRPMSR
jgi:hypothetical protein